MLSDFGESLYCRGFDPFFWSLFFAHIQGQFCMGKLALYVGENWSILIKIDHFARTQNRPHSWQFCAGAKCALRRTKYARLCAFCTQCTLCVHCVQLVHNVPLCTHSVPLCIQCTLCIHCALCTQCTLYVHCVHIVYTVCTFCTLCTQCTYYLKSLARENHCMRYARFNRETTPVAGIWLTAARESQVLEHMSPSAR